MAGKSSTEKELRWREILRRQAGSGRSVREFCAAEGISEPSFYGWRRKLGERKSAGGRSRSLRKAKPSGDAPEDGRLFVPLTLLDAPRTLEIVHPLGCRIQVTGDVNPVALRHVIEALDGRGER